jgi:hypothetical protein
MVCFFVMGAGEAKPSGQNLFYEWIKGRDYHTFSMTWAYFRSENYTGFTF